MTSEQKYPIGCWIISYLKRFAWLGVAIGVLAMLGIVWAAMVGRVDGVTAAALVVITIAATIWQFLLPMFAAVMLQAVIDIEYNTRD